MPLWIRIAKASWVLRGKASTGYLPLPREAQTAVPAPQLPCSSCSLSNAEGARDRYCHFLPVTSRPASGRTFQSSGCKIKSGACKHLFCHIALRYVRPKCTCFVLPECTGFSFSGFNSVLSPLWPGPLLPKPSKNLGPFPCFWKPQPCIRSTAASLPELAIWSAAQIKTQEQTGYYLSNVRRLCHPIH